MSNLAVIDQKFSQQHVDIIRKSVCPDLNAGEFEAFIMVAQRRGLDPLLNQIHAVKRQGRVTYQVGIDGFRLVASRTSEYAGMDAPKFTFGSNPKQPEACEITVYRIVRGQRVGFSASAYWDEFCPSGPQAFMWNKMPKTMLAKCAEAQALRKAFPGDLSGLYADEEMHQADKQFTIANVTEAAKIEKAIASKIVEDVPEFVAPNEIKAVEPEVLVGSAQAPVCCGKPMYVSKFVDQNFGHKPWYCAKCKKKVPVMQQPPIEAQPMDDIPF